MKDCRLFVLLRISKPEYNKTLSAEYKLYMNPLNMFHEQGLTEGQQDINEGLLSNRPFYLMCNEEPLVKGNKLYKWSNVYIYCMYGIVYDSEKYDSKNNKYFHTIPWECIKTFWQGEGTEMMIIKNTSDFIKKFEDAALIQQEAYAYGKVEYDLEEKAKDNSYFLNAVNDPLEFVFHKYRDKYEIQSEIRFAVISNEKLNHLELNFDKGFPLFIDFVRLEYGKNICLEFSNLEFDEETMMPVRFSSKINVVSN